MGYVEMGIADTQFVPPASWLIQVADPRVFENGSFTLTDLTGLNVSHVLGVHVDALPLPDKIGFEDGWDGGDIGEFNGNRYWTKLWQLCVVHHFSDGHGYVSQLVDGYYTKQMIPLGATGADLIGLWVAPNVSVQLSAVLLPPVAVTGFPGTPDYPDGYVPFPASPPQNEGPDFWKLVGDFIAWFGSQVEGRRRW